MSPPVILPLGASTRPTIDDSVRAFNERKTMDRREANPSYRLIERPYRGVETDTPLVGGSLYAERASTAYQADRPYNRAAPETLTDRAYLNPN